jgi:hypothetical protein
MYVPHRGAVDSTKQRAYSNAYNQCSNHSSKLATITGSVKTALALSVFQYSRR